MALTIKRCLETLKRMELRVKYLGKKGAVLDKYFYANDTIVSSMMCVLISCDEFVGARKVEGGFELLFM